MKIYKYKFDIVSEQTIIIHRTHKFLKAGLDPQGNRCVWFAVNTDSVPIHYKLYVVPTGGEIPHDAHRHLESFNEDFYVWHLFSCSGDTI